MADNKVKYGKQVKNGHFQWLKKGRSALISTLVTPLTKAMDSLHGRNRQRRKQQSRQTSWEEKKDFKQLVRPMVRILLLTILLLTAAGSGYLSLRNSDTFRLQTITVLGNRVTLENELLALGKVETGQSLLSLHAKEVAARITAHAWIDRVRIERAWPDTLMIRVYEHRPLAMVIFSGGEEKENSKESGKGLYYVDQNGKVFTSVALLQDKDFPVITGLPLSANRIGIDIAQMQLANTDLPARAFRFLHLAGRGNLTLPLQSISELHLDAEKGLIVYLVDYPFPIYMGFDNTRERFYQLVRLLDRLYRKKKIQDIDEIRMDYLEGRILVAMAQ